MAYSYDPPDEVMTDVDVDMEDHSLQVPPTPFTISSSYSPELPSPVTQTFDPSLNSPTPGKGKGKRPASDSDSDDDSDNDNNDSKFKPKLTNIFNPYSSMATSTILRRAHHRHHTVAATHWGRTLPDTISQPFNVYKAILRHPNLFFQFAIRLPPITMLDLYAIDKEFHYRFNKHSTSILHDFASLHAPVAAPIFSWRFFPDLCISDPMLRPMDNRPHLARDIPSLRWTQMVLHRDRTARGILTALAVEGHRVPRGTHTALCKLALLLSVRTTAVRASLLADPRVWTDADILLLHLLLVKLDMAFGHPVNGHGFPALSHLLLAQKSLQPLHDLLTGKAPLDYDDVTEMLVRTYLPEELDADAHDWLLDEVEGGVAEAERGLLRREGWDREGDAMPAAVDLAVCEGIKRRLGAQRWVGDMLAYGFVRAETQSKPMSMSTPTSKSDKRGMRRAKPPQNVPTPRRWRFETRIHTPSEAWPVESSRVAFHSALDARFGVSRARGGMVVRSSARDQAGQGNVNVLYVWDEHAVPVVGATGARNEENDDDEEEEEEEVDAEEDEQHGETMALDAELDMFVEEFMQGAAESAGGDEAPLANWVQHFA